MKRIVIAGGSGLIGTALRKQLVDEGHDVVVLTRRSQTQEGQVHWDPAQEKIASNIVDGASAVVNLCGVALPEKRWTARFKNMLVDSRVQPAAFLGRLVSRSAHPPGCYVGISGSGIYGDREGAIHEGDREAEQGFIPDLVRQWEAAHRNAGVSRTVVLRTSPVISARGGYLAKLLPPARFGIYPCFGNGHQIVSWIHLADIARMISYCISNGQSSGMYHAAAPGSLSQREFMSTLRRVSGRPGVLFPVPEFLLRTMFGEMSSVLFESTDLQPTRMLREGFQFRTPQLPEALRVELKK